MFVFWSQILPDADYDSAQKTELDGILLTIDSTCDDAKDIAEEQRSLREVRYVGVFCQKLVDGEIGHKDTSLDDTVAGITTSCTELLQFLDDEDIDLPEKDNTGVLNCVTVVVMYNLLQIYRTFL